MSGSGAIGQFTIGVSPIGGGAPPTGTPNASVLPVFNTGVAPPTNVTTVQFSPSPTVPFQFGAVFDGSPYNVALRWNVFGQRWYVSIFDETNTRILSLPLIGSPPDYDISITAGYFATTLVYRAATGTFEVSL